MLCNLLWMPWGCEDMPGLSSEKLARDPVWAAEGHREDWGMARSNVLMGNLWTHHSLLVV